MDRFLVHFGPRHPPAIPHHHPEERGTMPTMQPAEPCEQTTWGIIRYAAGSGMVP
jgi:hypothetical protein